MNLGGLSPEKAPPIEAPLGLFYLMPFFLCLTGLVLAWHGDEVMASRWTPAALAVTHFVVLGALVPVMCGALLQISPVLFGAPFPRVRLVAYLTAGGLGVGSLLIGAGFLLGSPVALLCGGVAATAGLAVFLVGSYHALTGLSEPPQTLWAVRLAALALAVTIVLGLTLVLARLGWLDLALHPRWVDTHVSWGLAGWIGLLLAGVGMEIIPMFYVSPPFAAWIKRLLPLTVLGLLILITVFALIQYSGPILKGLIVALFIVHLIYNFAALRVENRRQRPRRDANLWLWQGSHIAVFVAFFAWIGGGPQSAIGILLLGGALSFVIGSLIKIVPFLNWLDLQQRRVAGHHAQVKLPGLRTLLPERLANRIALTLGAATITGLLGTFVPVLAQFGGILLAVCSLLLAFALLKAARMRNAVIRDFDIVPSGSSPH